MLPGRRDIAGRRGGARARLASQRPHDAMVTQLCRSAGLVARERRLAVLLSRPDPGLFLGPLCETENELYRLLSPFQPPEEAL